MIWRLLPLATERGAMNMAIDEAVAEGLRDGVSPPTVRFYSWSPGAVSIGCFQSAREEVDVDTCARLGVDVIRRRTGGGAVYHDPDGEITYSVIAPEATFGNDIHTSYRLICGYIIDALGHLGIPSEFRPINDITVGGKKISGSAQTRRGGVFLQHGTLLLSFDSERMSLLRPSPAKLSARNSKSVEDLLTSVRSCCSASRDEVLDALRKGLRPLGEMRDAGLTIEERARANEIALSYDDDAWTFFR